MRKAVFAVSLALLFACGGEPQETVVPAAVNSAAPPPAAPATEPAPGENAPPKNQIELQPGETPPNM